jgi:hypothetical protein
VLDRRGKKALLDPLDHPDLKVPWGRVAKKDPLDPLDLQVKQGKEPVL